MYNLSQIELKILKKLSTPAKIQDYIDTLAINFEQGGETCMSPRRVLREKKAHCMEGAMLAALALRIHGHPPLVMDLKCIPGEDDHVVALFRQYGRWGAISKTNHAVLRYREPVYRDIRELTLSYFHEYFTDSGRKIFRSYSRPLDLSHFDKKNWMTTENNLFFIPQYLDKARHYPILGKNQMKTLRKADAIEIVAGKLIEWSKAGKRLSKWHKKR